MRIPRKLAGAARTAALGLLIVAAGVPGIAGADSPQGKTTTPIQHLVVIFGENVSFDHYFGTYPYATNPAGEPRFTAQAGTPSVNGLANGVTAGVPTGPLLTNNGNTSNPVLLDRSDAMTCDQNHDYTAEQLAADHGAEDMYTQNTGGNLTVAQCLAQENAGLTNPAPIPSGTAGSSSAAMAYYDGNTVTALWNYAQRFAMSDNAYTTTYGPSTPGALNLTSAQTYGAICGPSSATINDTPCAAPPGYNAGDVAASTITTSASGTTSVANQPDAGPGTDYSDADPYFDVCSYLPKSMGGDAKTPAKTIEMGGNNIGEALTTAGITWGWFQGGFDNGYVPGQGTPPTTAQICAQSHQNVGGATVNDYNPHHQPFQYYASTANPMHLPPTSVGMIGHTDQANHQYDLADFWAAADAGNLPAVSYLKAPNYQDGHAGYSDPLDEQAFLASTINHLESLHSWSSTAVIVTWDDSDGWYDHLLAPLVTGSQTSLDALTNPNTCGSTALVPTTSSGAAEQGKCGLGTRIPFLVISPFAKQNYVDNTLVDQSSVVRFIEDNWSLPAMGNGAADTAAGALNTMFDWQRPWNKPLFLNPMTGEPSNGPGGVQRQP